MDCEACVRSCPVSIDIRKGLQMACLHCAECADACSSRMKARGRKSLIGYVFGIPGNKNNSFRINALITGAIAILSLLFLVYLSASRMPFDMTVRLVYRGTESQSAGLPTSVYDISFRNMTGKDINLDLNVTSSLGTTTIEPNAVIVKKGADLTRIKATVSLQSAQRGTGTVTLIARSPANNKSISKKVYFIIPGTK